MPATLIWVAALLAARCQESAEPHERIRAAVESHCARHTLAGRIDMTDRLFRLVSAVPGDAKLREQCVQRVVRMVEMTTHLLPRDQEYLDLRRQHPELAELAVPDSYHLRAYEMTERKLAVSLRNAAVFSSRSPEARQRIADQVESLFADARRALLTKAIGPAAERAVQDAVARMLTTEFRPGLDSPFTGYVAPLDPNALARLQVRIADQLAAMPYLHFGDGGDASRIPHGAEVIQDPGKAGQAVSKALKAMYQIGRTFDPDRFTLLDQHGALVREAQDAWREAERAHGAAYYKLWDEAREKSRAAKGAGSPAPAPARPDGDPDEGLRAPPGQAREPMPAPPPVFAGSPAAVAFGALIVAAVLFGVWKWAHAGV